MWNLIYSVFFSFFLLLYITNVSIPEIKKNRKDLLNRPKLLRLILLPIIFGLMIIERIFNILGVDL